LVFDLLGFSSSMALAAFAANPLVSFITFTDRKRMSSVHAANVSSGY
jgi:hypothetical protein